MAGDPGTVAGQLREHLGVDRPFWDPLVAGFGLRNEVFCLGDQFVEVCTPVDGDAAGRRHLDRHGDSGYMVVLQVPDLAAARARVERLGIRVVWTGARDGITGIHLHPRDLPGAIVSLDQPEPPESWAWAGPGWTGRAGTGAPGRITGVTVAVADPDGVAARWAAVLGVEAHDPRLLPLGREQVRFCAGERGLAGIDAERPGPAADVEVCGVRLRLRDRTSPPPPEELPRAELGRRRRSADPRDG
jgi:hypothetical protein